MSFNSEIDCPVIEDSNVQDFMGGEDTFLPRDWDETPLGAIAVDGVPCAPVISLKPMDEKELIERAEEMERTKSRVSDKIKRKGMRAKMQAQTNFCASNATLGAVQAARIIQGYEHVELSAASVACRITNFQNRGHWPGQVAQLLAAKRGGAVPSSAWPDNAIDRTYDNAQTDAMRANFRCFEWWDLPKFSFWHLATALANGYAASSVFMFIKHVLLACDLVVQNGRLGIRYLNSYSIHWGNQGYAIMWSDKARPDECIVPRSVT